MMQCEGEARSPNLGKGVKMGLVLAPEGAMALYRRLTNVQTARLLQSIETTRGTMVHEALSGRVDLVLAKRLKEAYAESLASPLPIWVGAADQRSRASGVRSQVAKNLRYASRRSVRTIARLDGRRPCGKAFVSFRRRVRVRVVRDVSQRFEGPPWDERA